MVQSDPEGRPAVEAFSSQGAISVTPGLLTDPDPGRPVWVLSEEVAHRYLNEVFGIPHGGDFIDRFAQEGFGSWFQCHRMFQPGLYDPDDITTETIESTVPALGSVSSSASTQDLLSREATRAPSALRSGTPPRSVIWRSRSGCARLSTALKLMDHPRSRRARSRMCMLSYVYRAAN